MSDPSRRVLVDAGALAHLLAVAGTHPDPELRGAVTALIASGAAPPARGRDELSIAEYVAMTGLSESTVRRRIRDGTIPHRRVGRRVLLPRPVRSGQERSGAVNRLPDRTDVPHRATDTTGDHP